MSIRFPKTCKTQAQKSSHARTVARIRWDRKHAEMAGEPVRRERDLVCLAIQRAGIDPNPVTVIIRDDGCHRRRVIVEDGREWGRRCGRKSLAKWIGQVLKSAGV